MEGNELKKNLEKLITHIDSIHDTLPMVSLLTKPYRLKANKEFSDFVDIHVTKAQVGEGKVQVTVPTEHVKMYENLSKNASISNLANTIVAESLFVALISQYDAFFGRLLRILFQLKPELLNPSERQIMFSQLKEFASIDEIREYVIEKEIDSVMRKSHADHFSYLENKLEMKLREDLPIWKTFIEITERRNLFVHCGGVVSNQYLSVCNLHKVDTGKVKLNDKLFIENLEYFKSAYECLYELATKLTHTLWRKILPNDLEFADLSLNMICYDLIAIRQLRLCDILLDFANKQKKHFNDYTKNLFIINKALSFYLKNEKDTATKIIRAKDWSASSDIFIMASHIILDELPEVVRLMKKVGNEDKELGKEQYRSWPLFFKLRSDKIFKETYKEIFNEDYNVIEVPKRPVENMLHEQNSKRIKKKPKQIVEKSSVKTKDDSEGNKNKVIREASQKNVIKAQSQSLKGNTSVDKDINKKIKEKLANKAVTKKKPE